MPNTHISRHGKPTAEELVPAVPANIESATEMMLSAIADFQRATLRQAVLVSHAREQLFAGEASPWMKWCTGTCDLSRRYAVTLWHAGDVLRKCGNAALLDCDADKLEALAKLDDRELARFLRRNDPAEMTRADVRKSVAGLLDDNSDEEGDEDEPPAPKPPPSPVARHLRAIDLLSCVPDNDRLLIAAGTSPVACIQSGLACLDIGMHILSQHSCWDADQLRRWAPQIRSAVEVYEKLLQAAETTEA